MLNTTEKKLRNFKIDKILREVLLKKERTRFKNRFFYLQDFEGRILGHLPRYLCVIDFPKTSPKKSGHLCLLGFAIFPAF